MASSIRLPFTGASYRLTAMLSGVGAGFRRGLLFSMGLILCLCAGLIACFAVLSAQMRQPAQVVAVDPVAVDPLSAADKAFNARYYPLVDCPRFRFATLRQRMASWHGYMSLPYLYPTPDDLPTGDPSLKTPLYPRTPAVTPARDAKGALEVR
ncbi:hypothetical protein [Prosthecobacter sp.]|jgi:hypothetical protein|uniref:hypothetical protein n=1 Tax=Prosthecobacter sp. TaxID=1965333 RepID=UPI0037CA2BB7